MASGPSARTAERSGDACGLVVGKVSAPEPWSPEGSQAIHFPLANGETEAQRELCIVRSGPRIENTGLHGNSLAVQWLGLRASTSGGTGLIPDWGAKIPQAMQRSAKKKKI